MTKHNDRDNDQNKIMAKNEIMANATNNDEQKIVTPKNDQTGGQNEIMTKLQVKTKLMTKIKSNDKRN